jgi:hypothetical protein
MGVDVYLNPPPGPPQNHVVSTVYFKPGRKRPIMHAYGPMTKSRAAYVASRLRKGYAKEVKAGRMHITPGPLLPNALADPDFQGYQP